MSELVIHCVAPKPGALILGAPTTLETKPCTFGTLHISSSGSGLVVEQEVCLELLAMRGEVELWNHASNNLVVQTFSTIEWEFPQPLVKVC